VVCALVLAVLSVLVTSGLESLFGLCGWFTMLLEVELDGWTIFG
jgi:hypothetical protein